MQVRKTSFLDEVCKRLGRPSCRHVAPNLPIQQVESKISVFRADGFCIDINVLKIESKSFGPNLLA